LHEDIPREIAQRREELEQVSAEIPKLAARVAEMQARVDKLEAEEKTTGTDGSKSEAAADLQIQIDGPDWGSA
jgi:predicted  nucleic acid-binding Zn-ribbon protein